MQDITSKRFLRINKSKDTILRQQKPDILIDFYLSELEYFYSLFLPCNENTLFFVFDNWFTATYLKSTKTGKKTWKIK